MFFCLLLKINIQGNTGNDWGTTSQSSPCPRLADASVRGYSRFNGKGRCRRDHRPSTGPFPEDQNEDSIGRAKWNRGCS